MNAAPRVASQRHAARPTRRALRAAALMTTLLAASAALSAGGAALSAGGAGRPCVSPDASLDIANAVCSRARAQGLEPIVVLPRPCPEGRCELDCAGLAPAAPLVLLAALPRPDRACAERATEAADQLALALLDLAWRNDTAAALRLQRLRAAAPEDVDVAIDWALALALAGTARAPAADATAAPPAGALDAADAAQQALALAPQRAAAQRIAALTWNALGWAPGNGARTIDPAQVARALGERRAWARALVEALPHLGRLAAEQELLPAWGAALAGGDAVRAAQHLAELQELASLLVTTQGDTLLVDTLDHMQALAPRQRRDMADAIAWHARGSAAIDAEDYASALVALTAAHDVLRLVGSPWSKRVALDLGRALYLHERPGESRAVLQRLESELAATQHLHLRARCASAMGLLLTQQDRRPDRARAAYEQALELLERTGDVPALRHVQFLLVEALDELRRPAAAWVLRQELLRHVASVACSDRSFAVWGDLLAALRRERRPWLAARVADVMVADARRGTSTYNLAAALWLRGNHERGLDPQAAAADIAEARGLLDQVDGGLRTRLEGFLALEEGALLVERDPQRALASLSRSQAALHALGMRQRDVELATRRAQAQRARGDVVAVRREVRMAVALAERTQATLTDPGVRLAHGRLVDEAQDALLEVELDGGADVARLFEISARGRGRSLSAEPGALPAASEPTWRRVQRALPRHGAFVLWHVLPTRTLAWVITTTAMSHEVLPIDARQLARDVGALRGLASQGQIHAAAEAEARVAARLGPVLRHLPARGPVFMAAHGALLDLPFAALRLPGQRRLLVERHTLVSVPSVAAWLRPRASGRPHGTPTSLLVIADPRLSPERRDEFAPLPAARREARALAALRPSAQVVQDAAATRAALVNAAGQVRILHLAVHVSAARGAEEQPFIVLAPDENSRDGAVYAHELAEMRFEGTALVVVSGCGTAFGPDFGGEGLISIARAFLAAGVPSVVGTLWSVDDREAQRLATAFHRHLLTGHSAAEALHHAQIDALSEAARSRNPRMDWAAFQLLGSDVTP